MPLTRSKAKQSLQKPSTSSTVSIDENVVAFGGRGGHKPKRGPCLDEKMNPLLNNVVLTTLFEFVKGKDLKTCRLVCKQWNTLSLPFVRSQFHVEIFEPRQYSLRGIGSFMELIGSNTLEIPFGRYLLHGFNTAKGFSQFLRTCGSSAKEIILHRDWDEYQSIENVGELLKSALKLESFTIPRNYLSSKNEDVVQLFSGLEDTKPKLPHLKCLNVGWSYRKEDNDCPTFYMELFRAAPNISTVDLGDGMFFVCLEVLETIEKLGRESIITSLKISGVKEKHLEILRRMALKRNGLKLKKLDLTDIGLDDDFDFLGFALVELFKNSLIALRLNSHNNSQLMTFPNMPKMKRLHFILSCYETHLSFENFGNIFPSLEELDIDSSNQYPPYNNFLIGNDPCPTYKSSILRRGQLKMENLNGILKIFPTLKFLECRIREKDGVAVIRKIWSHMSQLEGLSVYGPLKTSEDLDSLVTGISVRQFKKLGNKENFFESLQNEEISDREVKIQNKLSILTKNSQLPSIRNLTNLRFLALQLTGTGYSARKKSLTDLTAYFGLYALKNLQHLNIVRCEFSKSCCEVLVKDKTLINWDFSSTSNQKIIPVEWNEKTISNYEENF